MCSPNHACEITKKSKMTQDKNNSKAIQPGTSQGKNKWVQIGLDGDLNP